MNGVLIVDKPAGVSSALAVDRVKHAIGVRRVGHGGTLDPLATGVLAICLGGATKIAQYLLADDKEYEAEGLLGVEMDTLDRTGTVTAERPVSVTREAMLAAISQHTGELDQIPPMFSAIKQDGVRMYTRARAGELIDRAARRIRIDRLELVMFEPPRFRISIACSKGTYVRSLVADLGTAVGAGAHLTELRRTRSGSFTLAQAIRLDRVGIDDLTPYLIPMSAAVNLPRVTVSPDFHGSIRSGVQLPVERFTTEIHQKFQMVDEGGKLLAIVHVDDGRVIYDRVFPEA
ncbi:MAG: tRNA pseudouridine(55) synthase TruB [Deltaproteobacteria bacterium]|nr:tRNA pseudouridine(55) synthase TruB [Deltaproteobacteria bacterium]